VEQAFDICDGVRYGGSESGGEIGAARHIQTQIGEEDDKQQHQDTESQALTYEYERAQDGIFEGRPGGGFDSFFWRVSKSGSCHSNPNIN